MSPPTLESSIHHLIFVSFCLAICCSGLGYLSMRLVRSIEQLYHMRAAALNFETSSEDTQITFVGIKSLIIKPNGVEVDCDRMIIHGDLSQPSQAEPL